MVTSKDILKLSNDHISVSVIPKLGGKIISFHRNDNNFDVVACKQREYRTVDAGGRFEEYDRSGLDDAFPNIDPEEYIWNGKHIDYLDHGSIWRSKMHIDTIGGDYLELSYINRDIPFLYKKSYKLNNNSLIIRYHIENLDEPFPCFWTFHGLLKYAPDVEIIYPKGISNIENVLENSMLGEKKEYNYPSYEYDFNHPLKYEPSYMIKYYGQEMTENGHFCIRWPSNGITLDIDYDHKILSWIGVWVTVGGYYNDYNFAVEMTNGYYDSISRAVNNKKYFLLEKELDFEIKLSLSNV
ncbi:Galactose mutarotase [Butyrivibrio sp. Su6]|uniref:hypothetical protein n=1 Tax=Butyrivibrio sp. Su6 TaxID=1520810 RepID=UPI00089E11FA|nr:hypothetical protein [Butyrivibrio sp. Su6]SEF57583.1 Galactose mutarotase [Butyrivibrio sp. Su6]